MNKKQFMMKPKIRNLPAAEKERRYKQHLMSLGGIEQVHGRGDYFSDIVNYVDRKVLQKIPRGTFAKIGGTVGGAPGALVGDLVSQITGRGDYTIKKNSLIKDGKILNPSEMSFAPTGAAAIRVQKREFIQNIVAPVNPEDFTQLQVRLQCTDGHAFPWLSGIAKHFTEWECHGAIYSYESTSSNFAQNMALGTIAIATQYNANEIPYSNMEEMLQAAYHSRCNPSESMMHGIECDPELQASEHLFTRRFGTSGPPNLYDHGVVTIATEGLPASPGTVIGRLFVTYDIELNLPALPNDHLNTGLSAQLLGAASTTNPPMGETLSIIGNSAGGLSYGPSPGNNVMALLPSNGPHARPQVPPADRAGLVGWVSDSNVSAGMQYLSFANPGDYLLEIIFLGATANPGGSFATVSPLDPDIAVTVHPVLLQNNVAYYRVGIKASAADRSLSITRQLPDDVTSWSIITVC